MTKCWPDLSTPAVARPCPSNWSNVVPRTTSRTGLPSAPYTDTSPLSNFHVASPDPSYEMTKCWPDLSTPAVARPCPSNLSNGAIHNLTNQLAARVRHTPAAVVEPRGRIPRRVVRDTDWSRPNRMRPGRLPVGEAPGPA